jgi:hypothetical protein
MSDLIEILKMAKDTVGSLVSRKRVVAEKSWDEVVLALDKLNELCNHHVKAVAEVTGPLVSEGNLLESSRRYAQLANNPDFPQGYDEIRGILAAAQKLPSFKGTATEEHIRSVLDELHNFQYAVFTPSWDSYRVADAFAEAAQVASSPEASPESIARTSDPFIKTFTGLFQEEAEPKVKDPPTTKEGLVVLIQRWVQLWQRHVQRTLYGGKGLSFKIAQLKMQRHA